MKKWILTLITLICSEAYLASAATVRFYANARSSVPPFNLYRVGTVEVDWEDGTPLYNNDNLRVTVTHYTDGTPHTEEFTAQAHGSEPSTAVLQQSGGKEHDAWLVKNNFVLSGQGRYFAVWMELRMFGNSVTFANGVREGGAHLRRLGDSERLELNVTTVCRKGVLEY